MKIKQSDIRKSWCNVDIEKIPSSLKLGIKNGISKSAKILDIGCGNGDDLRFLELQGFKYLYGIDINQQLIISTKKHSNSIHMSVQDAAKTNFSNCYFDYAIMKALLTVLVSDVLIVRALKESYRVLKKGGVLQIDDFFQNWHIELYRNRYLNSFQTTGKKCTFPVFGNNGGIRYYARHFNVYDISLMLIKVGFEIIDIQFKDAVTQSGNNVIGFTIMAIK